MIISFNQLLTKEEVGERHCRNEVETCWFWVLCQRAENMKLIISTFLSFKTMVLVFVNNF